VSGVTVSSDGVVTGNTFDKYGSTNPLVRRLMRGFERSAEELKVRHALRVTSNAFAVECH